MMKYLKNKTMVKFLLKIIGEALYIIIAFLACLIVGMYLAYGGF